ncbi:MAG: hypothetical protein HZB53_03220 [Chloroflexi bacterium]|nr:hypothetical protein [Chloroflexota bacterium]
MFTLISSLSLRRLLIEQAPVMVLSFIVAELFYKFHSFTLETGAFLVTWGALDFIVQFAIKRLAPARPTA